MKVKYFISLLFIIYRESTKPSQNQQSQLAFTHLKGQLKTQELVSRFKAYAQVTTGSPCSD